MPETHRARVLIIGAGPEQMSAMLKGELERWTPVIKASGAVAD